MQLNIGIVGKNYSETYSTIINKFDFLNLTGIFDPSFQFEYPKQIDRSIIFHSFANLIDQSDALIFASSENIYLPLIELAIKRSKSVFLHSVHNFSYKEQLGLQKLQEEACEVIQIQNPIAYFDTFQEFRQLCQKPLLLNYDFSNSTESKLLLHTRSIIGAILPLFKNNIKKTTVNIISACSAVPDIYKLRIDFDNGSIAEIIANSAQKKANHQIKCFGYNEQYEVDLLKNSLSGVKNDKKINSVSVSEKNIPHYLIEKQIIDFYWNISNFKIPINSIDNEVITQQIIEKVKEKLRISINIF